MFRLKQEPDALDLTNRPQHLLSPATDHDDDDEEDSLPKKTIYDSGFIDTSDENNNSSLMVKQERNHHQYHSTPLRPQQIHGLQRHPSTSSSACSSSPPPREQSNDKECRNTRFLGSRAVAVLNQWFQLNRDYPYPDDERTDELASEAGITQKQVKKWFANKRVRSQTCYKPLYRSRKSRNSSTLTPSRAPQTNYNYIINHNNIAPPPPPAAAFPPTNPMLFNPMATSMMMLMMQQHFMSTMMAAGLPPQTPLVGVPPTLPAESSTTTKKPNTDRITRFWL